MPNPQKILLIDDDATMAGHREPCAVSVGRKDVTGSEVGGSIGMGVSPMGLETSGSEARACTGETPVPLKPRPPPTSFPDTPWAGGGGGMAVADGRRVAMTVGGSARQMAGLPRL